MEAELCGIVEGVVSEEERAARGDELWRRDLSDSRSEDEGQATTHCE